MTRLEQIRQLVAFAINAPKNQNRIVKLGALKEHEVERIEKLTGFNLAGYERILDRFAIGHTLKIHGDVEVEAERGQVAVTDKDFEKIPRILKTENIIFIGQNKKGKDLFLYEAVIGNTFYYVEEIRTRRKQLAMVSMYKRKPRKKRG